MIEAIEALQFQLAEAKTRIATLETQARNQGTKTPLRQRLDIADMAARRSEFARQYWADHGTGPTREQVIAAVG
jgi:hypothetical protein